MSLSVILKSEKEPEKANKFEDDELQELLQEDFASDRDRG